MASNRIGYSQQLPPTYDPGTIARLLRGYDKELTRLTAFANTVTWNPANVLDGDNATTTVAVPGVQVGVPSCVRVFTPYSLQGMAHSGYVSADDVVTIVVNNNTGGAINLDSGEWAVVVENFLS